MGQIWSDLLSCNKEAEHLEIFLLVYFENRIEPAERNSNFDFWFGLMLHIYHIFEIRSVDSNIAIKTIITLIVDKIFKNK